ncbi:MAG TPA: hypothetical protein PKB06_04010, partial [Actinotalea sp.]|nr:hypothetical protein [Actinotalea sp.]
MDHGWDEHQALASRSRAALLEVLVTAGLVARAPERRTTRGRPRILYRRLEPVGARMKAALDRVLLAGYGTPMDSPAEVAAAAGRAAAGSIVERLPEQTADAEEADAVLVDHLDR